MKNLSVAQSVAVALHLPGMMAKAQDAAFNNDIDSLIPEMWAAESLMQLEKLSVMPYLVHRDFDALIANHGDVVNAHRPANFKMKRKGVNDDVVDQDAKATTVPVKLDQHLHVSFVLRDGQEAKSFKDLAEYFLTPAIRTIAEGLDQILANQVYNFTANAVGSLGTAPSKGTLSLLKALMTNNRVPAEGRVNVLTANTEAALVSLDAFSDADKVGDEGTALREGSLGRKFGANNIADIAVPSLVGNAAGATRAINNAAGYPKFHTGPIAIDGAGGATPGLQDIALINGRPYTIATINSATNITLVEPLHVTVADNAVISFQPRATVNGAYPVGHSKEVSIDAGLRAQPVGTALRDVAGNIYTIVDTSDTVNEYLLDRPLAAALADDATLGSYPDGDYNFCFHRDALALVTRPLPQPREGTGALSAVINENNIAIRVTITYDGKAQGHRITLDLLAGVQVLDEQLGAVILA